MAFKDKKKEKEYFKNYYVTHADKMKEYNRRYRKLHKTEKRDYQNSYLKNDTNSLGIRKVNIRIYSNRYLFNTLKHAKLKGYEIHHCFGYDNHKSFIYIPKELHLQIHQFLRDNEIVADSNHYAQIAHLINEWDGYTYIKV